MVILLIRTSTERQEIETQLAELKEFAYSFGYTDNDFIVVGQAGASAIKLDEQYMENINKVYTLIDNRDITDVFAWAIDRIGRNEELLMGFKNKLIQSRVNLHIKNPTLTLLNDDGTVNAGVELTFSLFATMAKQEMEMKKERFARAKNRDRLAGKFLGGMYVLFGYSVDENGFLQINEEQANILRTIFSLYATGNYSYNTLRKEIMERFGMDVSTSWLRCKFNDVHYYNGIYPPIVSEELFNACQNVKNNARDKHLKQYHTFANRLIRCSKCGYGYTQRTANKQPVYHCKFCRGNFITAANLDGLLWLICSNYESQRMLKEDSNSEILTNKAVLSEKLQQVDKQYQKYEKVRQRAKEAYLNGIIDLSEYNQRLEGIKKDIVLLDNRKLEYQRQITLINEMLKKKDSRMERLLAIADRVQSSDEIAMRDIVRRWVTRIDFADRMLEIHTLKGTYRAKYVAKGEKKVIFETINGNPLMVAPIKRQNGVVTLDVADKRTGRDDSQRLINTIRWLSGDETV